MKKFIFVSLFSIAFFLYVPLYAQNSSPDTLNGVIDEYEHDSDGTLTSVVFNVLDEDFNTIGYIVVNNNIGMQLLDLVGENIDLIGTIKDNGDGTKSITVLEYFIPDDDDYSAPDDPDTEQ